MRARAAFRDERTWPVVVFAAALLLRLAHVVALSRSPYFTHPILDAETYYNAARALAGGQGYPDRVFWQPPGYPYFLALVFAVWGPGFWMPRLLQAIFGAVSALLTYAIGARTFGPRVGLLAGLGAAGYGTLIYLEGELLTPSLAILLQLAAVYLAVRARQTTGGREWFGAGLFGGLAALVNATALVLVPVMALFARRRAAWVVLGATLAIGPVSLRNWVLGDQFVLISSNLGVNLYVGNNPRYDAMVAMRPGRDWHALLRAPRQEGVTGASAASRFFVRRVVTFARTDPIGFVRLQARKLGLLVAGNEILRNQEIYPTRAYSPVLRVLLWKTVILAFPFGVLLPLGVVGLAVGARRASMLATMCLVFATGVVAFFITARYRAPLVPFLLVFAAEGGRWLVASAGPSTRLAAGATIVALFGLANVGQGPMPTRMNPDAEFGLAVWLEREGRRDDAIALYRVVARDNPTYWDAWNRLGQVLEAAGRHQEAVEAFRAAQAIVPEHLDTLLLLANVWTSEGRLDPAIDYYRRALVLDPGSLAARSGLERALAEQWKRGPESPAGVESGPKG
jgi:4-amino-4-deoxy-L-arabinose transferase-like glycosyltransferase